MSKRSYGDSSLQIDKENCVVTLINIGHAHPDKRKIDSGFLIIELFDEKHDKRTYCAGKKFGIGAPTSITTFSPEQKIKKLLPEGSMSVSWNVNKNDIIKFKPDLLTSSPEKTNPEDLPFYSNQKAEKILSDHFNIAPISRNDPFTNFQSTALSLNPFKKLVESRYFPLARLRRSNLFKRFKDAFRVLYGGSFVNNQLGILDYLFPWARLLPNLIVNVAIPLQILLAIPTMLAIAFKTFIASFIMLLVSPIIVVVHLGFKVAEFLSPSESTDSVFVNPIAHEELETFDDLTASVENPISFNSYAKTHHKLKITPLGKNLNANQYETLTQTRKLEKDEALVLGISSKGKPSALLEVKTTNRRAIYSLMKKNISHIDEGLETANVMETMLRNCK